MQRQLRINMAVEEIWKEFANRMQQEDVTNYTIVLVTAKKRGGDLIAVLNNAAEHINEKIEVKREIQTSLAEKKLEFKIMSLIPYGIIIYMWFSFPATMEMLYGNLVGVIVMTVCLCLYIFALWAGKTIMDIEV